MDFLTTIRYLEQARKIVSEGARDLATQRKLVERMEANGGASDSDLFLLAQLEKMQCTYVKHRDKLEYKLFEELVLDCNEDPEAERRVRGIGLGSRRWCR
jgi:hypothetical protein